MSIHDAVKRMSAPAKCPTCGGDDAGEATAPIDGEVASVGPIMRHTGLPLKEAKAVFHALNEGQSVFNEARRLGVTRVTLNRQTLSRLVLLAGAACGMTNLAGSGQGGMQ